MLLGLQLPKTVAGQRCQGRRCPAQRLIVRAQAAPTKPDVKTSEYQGVYNLQYDISNENPNLTRGWKKTLTVAVSGAAGQISNHLLFMIASGEAFGKNQPIALQLLGSERSREALEGVAMELEDSLYPLLRQVTIGIEPLKIFKGADYALLIGAKPRGPGMERAELLDINGSIFKEQGAALNEVADRNCKVMVVGNPCNTNALIAMRNAPNLNPYNFHALTRLDENRAKCQLAIKAGKFYTSVSNVAVWGNHSTTQVPDFINAKIGGKPATEAINDMQWFKEEFTPRVATRGGALIKKWGRSSAASTAVSIVDAIRSLNEPTPAGDCFSSAVYSKGNPYGINENIFYSMPLRSNGDGSFEIVEGFVIDDYLRSKIEASEDEIVKEAKCVSHLTGDLSAEECAIIEETWIEGER